MSDVLSIGFRPKRFSEMVGVSRVTDVIKRQMASKRQPKAFMFVGESGVGKTTLARIIAVSLQCRHAEFGEPCDACIKNQHVFDIHEINASEVRGVDDIGQMVEAANYLPKEPSRRRIFLFDEAQMITGNAQNLMLKHFEDCPPTTVFIICTTDPGKILKTLRRRCLTFTLPGLGVNGMTKLVTRALKYVGSKKSAEDLAEALLEAGVTSSGLAMMAVEKYVAGAEAKRAAQVIYDTELNTLAICRSVFAGQWDSVREEMKNATPGDVRAVRASVAGYLKSVLLGKGVGTQARLCAEAIQDLGAVPFEDALLVPNTIAVLYKLCRKFGKG